MPARDFVGEVIQTHMCLSWETGLVVLPFIISGFEIRIFHSVVDATISR